MKFKPFKDNNNFLNITYQEFYVDNNRKTTVSETYHNGKVFINIREFVKSSTSSDYWIPKNGLFMLPEKMLTFWEDLNKSVVFLMNKNVDLNQKNTTTYCIQSDNTVNKE